MNDDGLKQWGQARVGRAPTSDAASALIHAAERRRTRRRGSAVTALVAVGALVVAGALQGPRSVAPEPVAPEPIAAVVAPPQAVPVVLFQAGDASVTAGRVQSEQRLVFTHQGHTVGVQGELALGEVWTLEQGALAVDTPGAIELSVGQVQVRGDDVRVQVLADPDAPSGVRLWVERGVLSVQVGWEWIQITDTWPPDGGPARIEELLHVGVWTPPDAPEPTIERVRTPAPSVDLGVLRSRLVQGDDAVRSELIAYLDRAPTDADAWALLAKAERMGGDRVAELNAWTAITQLPAGPQTATARYEAARLSPPDQAVTHLRALLDGGAGALEPEARLALGRALLELGDPAADAELNALIDAFPGSAAAASAEKLLGR
jgi:hypothetical protein